MQKAGKLNEILASYVDGFELVDALVSLRAGQVKIPHDLLRRALDGQADASRESPKNNQGRNALFELSVGAMLARQNLKPLLGAGNPDVEFSFEGHRILVECKRVLAENRTLPVLSEGIRQLRKQVDLSKGDVGIVAVNISRLFHSGNGFWIVPANTDVRELLSSGISRFVDKIGDEIMRKQDAAARGALFYAVAPFYVQGMGYTPGRSGTFCAFDLKRDEFLTRLASSIAV